MENAEELLQILETFSKLKPKDIPKELDEYLSYVARTGETIFRWNAVQALFLEKLAGAIKDFHDTTPSIEDLDQCPNVDPFHFDRIKTALMEKFETFHSAPFTIQRISELIIDPKKYYSRLDKFMRALEKNILVVSTIDPQRGKLSDNGESLNGGDHSNELDNDKQTTSNNSAETSTTATTSSTTITITVTDITNNTTEITNEDNIAKSNSGDESTKNIVKDDTIKENTNGLTDENESNNISNDITNVNIDKLNGATLLSEPETITNDVDSTITTTTVTTTAPTTASVTIEENNDVIEMSVDIADDEQKADELTITEDKPENIETIETMEVNDVTDNVSEKICTENIVTVISIDEEKPMNISDIEQEKVPDDNPEDNIDNKNTDDRVKEESDITRSENDAAVKCEEIKSEDIKMKFTKLEESPAQLEENQLTTEAEILGKKEKEKIILAENTETVENEQKEVGTERDQICVQSDTELNVKLDRDIEDVVTVFTDDNIEKKKEILEEMIVTDDKTIVTDSESKSVVTVSNGTTVINENIIDENIKLKDTEITSSVTEAQLNSNNNKDNVNQLDKQTNDSIITKDIIVEEPKTTGMDNISSTVTVDGDKVGMGVDDHDEGIDCSTSKISHKKTYSEMIGEIKDGLDDDENIIQRSPKIQKIIDSDVSQQQQQSVTTNLVTNVSIEISDDKKLIVDDNISDNVVTEKDKVEQDKIKEIESQDSIVQEDKETNVIDNVTNEQQKLETDDLVTSTTTKENSIEKTILTIETTEQEIIKNDTDNILETVSNNVVVELVDDITVKIIDTPAAAVAAAEPLSEPVTKSDSIILPAAEQQESSTNKIEIIEITEQMTVEETTTDISDNVMEAIVTLPSEDIEEKMEVDESNSVDPMDL